MASQSSMSEDNTDIQKVEGVGETNGPSMERSSRELEEQFNMQRAKMKELFLQKEEDMRRMLLDKEQLESEVMGLRAELQQLQTLSENQKSEIQSLQLLVNETVEVSSSGTEELRRLRAKNIELEQQLAQLRQQQQEMSLAPATIVRTLARKLGADAEPETPNKKQNADENELLRSIIQPLEMEISALKNKLRETDAQLQEALKLRDPKVTGSPGGAGVAPGGDTKTETVPEAPRQCDMCANYEKQLVSEQTKGEAARERAARLDQALRQATEELEGVRSLHDETVRSWQVERSQVGEEVERLREAVRQAEAILEARAKEVEQASLRALHQVTELTVDRETLQRKMDSLERDNAMLIGQYIKKAAEMQNEIINLPDNVEELQEHTLRLREQLLVCQIGREEAAEAEAELRGQLLEQGALFHRQEAELATARGDLREAREQIDRLQTEREQMKELGDKLRHSNDMIERLLEDKKRLQSEVHEMRTKVSVLQQELDNSEKVQQDFVRLSQSLQVQLERIREAETEVRWQHEEDVVECPSCHTHLPTPKKKVHCRHCGRIFCGSCVSHAIPSGPRGTLSRVCAVCSTLLQPHTKPYFSTDPPHND